MRGAHQSAREAGSQVGQAFASRGINSSPLAAGVEGNVRGRIYQSAQESLTPLRQQIAVASAQDRVQAQRVGEHENRQGWSDTLLALGGSAMKAAEGLTGQEDEATLEEMRNTAWIEAGVPRPGQTQDDTRTLEEMRQDAETLGGVPQPGQNPVQTSAASQISAGVPNTGQARDQVAAQAGTSRTMDIQNDLIPKLKAQGLTDSMIQEKLQSVGIFPQQAGSANISGVDLGVLFPSGVPEETQGQQKYAPQHKDSLPEDERQKMTDEAPHPSTSHNFQEWNKNFPASVNQIKIGTLGKSLVGSVGSDLMAVAGTVGDNEFSRLISVYNKY